MRKIEENIWRVVKAKTHRKFGNVEVIYQPSSNSSWVYLHGNHIAIYRHTPGELEVNKDTLARWPTPTTKSRLRALGANVTTKRGTTYLNGVAI